MAKTYTAVTVANATAGNAILASDHSTNFQNVNNLIVPPAVRATRSTSLSNTDIAWETASTNGGFDTDSMWSAGNPARITFNTAGIYLVTFQYLLNFSGTATVVEAFIRSSSGAFLVDEYKAGSFTTAFQGSISILYAFTAGDYVTARMAISGGTTYAISTYDRSAFSAVWVGRTS